MNKKLISAFLVLASLEAIGQTVGDDFRSTEAMKPGGKIRTFDGDFTYEHFNPEQELNYLYFFSPDSVCTGISIRPASKKGRDGFIQALDYYLPKSAENKWYEERDDGSVMGITLTFVDGSGDLFLLGMLK